MIVVELRFSSDAAERLAARPAHRDLLARWHAEGFVVAAGPWPDESGALLLFDADEATVRQRMTEDPYYRTPGVTVHQVREWHPVVGGPASVN
ncbi:YciI family protein [Plantactinospora sp. B24E8]|uniref:YciI family protein n=1 Tax=Plantactinospora sp. B24E8 TaxID=3153567 RepID=UPI00325CCDAC